jgi:hypothetical protein
MLLHVALIIYSDQELKSRKHVQNEAWEILVPVNKFMRRSRKNQNQFPRLLHNTMKKIKTRIAILEIKMHKFLLRKILTKSLINKLNG